MFDDLMAASDDTVSVAEFYNNGEYNRYGKKKTGEFILLDSRIYSRAYTQYKTRTNLEMFVN